MKLYEIFAIHFNNISAAYTLHTKAYSNDNEDYSCSTKGGGHIVPEEYFYAIAQIINIYDGEVKYKAEDEPSVTVSWNDIEKTKKELTITTTAQLKYQIFLAPDAQPWQEVYKIKEIQL